MTAPKLTKAQRDEWVIKFRHSNEFLSTGKTGTKILWGSLEQADRFPTATAAIEMAKRHWPKTWRAVLDISIYVYYTDAGRAALKDGAK